MWCEDCGMGLFQRKVQTDVKPLFYSPGLQKTVLVVGLGNPGKDYAETRHNIGFMCIDNYASIREFSNWSNKKDFQCDFSMQLLGGNRIILIKPSTYMNNSGLAVRAVQQFYEIPNEQTLVVHDELDIKFGQIRTRTGGSSAGHNGLNSLIEHLGKDFARIRIGVGNSRSAKADSSKFVLGKFSANEKKQLGNLTREVASIIDEFVHLGKLDPTTRNFLI